MTLELASADDAQSLNLLINEAYRGQAGWTTEIQIIEGARTSTKDVANLIQNQNTHLFTAKINGEIAACICVEAKENQTYIGTFAVNPNYQNQGIGKQVLHLAETFAVNQLSSKKIMMLVISQRKELISFYERRGYKRTGVITDFPVHLNVGIPTIEGLTIECLEKTV